MCAYAPYDIENVHVIGYDVVSNRPKVAAYRAPGAPISEYGVESVVDEIAKKLGIDPIELRLMNAAHEGTKAAYGPKFGPVGLEETLNAIKKTEHWNTPLRKWQGRGVASGFWFNIGGETCVSLTVNEDGTISLMAGTPDIGGLRASLAAVAADELGVPYDKVRPIIGDTGSLGFNFLTGGSRSAFSGSMAIVEAAKQIKADLCARACKLWEAKPDQVEFAERPRAAAGRAGREGEAHVHRGLRQGRRQDRRAHRRRRPHQRPGRRPELRHAPGGPGGGSRRPAAPPSCATRWPRTRGGRSTPPMSRGSTRAAPCRASAGRSTRSTSTAPTASSRTPASSTTACRWPPTCR